jgi:hypothetical protein
MTRSAPTCRPVRVAVRGSGSSRHSCAARRRGTAPARARSSSRSTHHERRGHPSEDRLLELVDHRRRRAVARTSCAAPTQRPWARQIHQDRDRRTPCTIRRSRSFWPRTCRAGQRRAAIPIEPAAPPQHTVPRVPSLKGSEPRPLGRMATASMGRASRTLNMTGHCPRLCEGGCVGGAPRLLSLHLDR